MLVYLGVCAGLSSQQWGQKKAAAKALVDLAEAGGDALPPHTPALISTLLQVCTYSACFLWSLCSHSKMSTPSVAR